MKIKQSLHPQSFYPCISPYIDYNQLVVGLSGGIDSMVLLHLLSRYPAIKIKLQAVYVNHQLSPQAEAWSEFCQSVCQQYGIPFRSCPVDAHPAGRQSPEAAAREARYQLFAELLSEQDCLLTAHHANDQSETLLLQLFRGSGPRGLAAMADSRAHQHFTVARPLLSFSRQQIKHYADTHQLQWIEDESNQDLRIKRNFLRHRVLPLITQQWPGIHQTLNRASMIQSETDAILQEVAEQDIRHCSEANDVSEALEPRLNRKKMLELSLPRLKNCLQRWLRQHQAAVLSAQLLQIFIKEFIQREATSQTEINWNKHHYLRYYRGFIYLSGIDKQLDSNSIEWDLKQHSRIVCRPFLLAADRQLKGRGLKTGLLSSRLTVSFRQGGEVFQKYKNSAHYSLKNWFQENHIPPWLRNCMPLIYQRQDLIQIGNQIVNRDYLQKDSPSLIIKLTIL